MDALLRTVQRSAAAVLARPVDKMDLEDRDAYLYGDDAVLTRYGFQPTPSHISAIVISVHPERRNEWDGISDLDDEELERVERQRERKDRRRRAQEAERRQLEAIEAAREEVPPAPANAYSPDYDREYVIIEDEW